MSGYVKLFGSIVHSTIWREPDHVRLLWVTMLALADRDGCVEASVPGLADAARLSIAQTQQALARLQEPDEFSRTPDHEGRRIAPVGGGWVLLNHALYRAKASSEEAREKAAERKRRQREREVTLSHAESRRVTPVPSGHDIAAPAPAPAPAFQSMSADADALPPRFAEFWSVYPRDENKKAAAAAWKKKRLDSLADIIIADVHNRAARHRAWRESVIPHASTYLNGERWTDAIDESEPRTNGAQRASSGREAPLLRSFDDDAGQMR